jgi:hypothetical protein
MPYKLSVSRPLVFQMWNLELARWLRYQDLQPLGYPLECPKTGWERRQEARKPP